jgi:hypothetical protein
MKPGYTLTQRGSDRAVARLKALQYDPIKELVDLHTELEIEVERQKKIRAGEIVELTSTGKPRAYRAEVHHALYDKLIAIGKELIKYGYSPQSSGNGDGVAAPPKAPLVIQLTEEGETYVVNDPSIDAVEDPLDTDRQRDSGDNILGLPYD